MSALRAPANPHRIKATHRRRRRVALGRFVQRYYDADIGRFISPDPVGPEEDFIKHFNRYNYAYNNPVRFIDPDGRKTKAGQNCGEQPCPEPPEKDKPSRRDQAEQRARERLANLQWSITSFLNGDGYWNRVIKSTIDVNTTSDSSVTKVVVGGLAVEEVAKRIGSIGPKEANKFLKQNPRTLLRGNYVLNKWASRGATGATVFFAYTTGTFIGSMINELPSPTGNGTVRDSVSDLVWDAFNEEQP